METISDTPVQPVMAPASQIVVNLPLDASVMTMQDGSGSTLYFCDGYTVQVSTLESGDLDKTLRQVTGFGKDQLKLMSSFKGDAKRYDCAWTAAGEGEDQVCRACILDDGSYHYVVSLMAEESKAGQLQQNWQDIFVSFRLAAPGEQLNTGS